MSELEIGDVVRASHDKFSEVFFFGHRDESTMTEYVMIYTDDDATITLAAGHYLYVNGRITAAAVVSVGDILELDTGAKTTVRFVTRKELLGQFAPHTIDGDITVDHIRASSYTTAVHPTLAHLLLTPLRMLYRFGYPAFTFLEKTSRYTLARRLSLPAGPTTL